MYICRVRCVEVAEKRYPKSVFFRVHINLTLMISIAYTCKFDFNVIISNVITRIIR